MPIVTVTTARDWCPPDDRDDPLDPEGSFNARQQLTFMLGRAMPEIVAQALSGLAFYTKPEEVVVEFVLSHGRSINTPDIRLVVSPMWSEDREQEQDAILEGIISRVNRFLFLRVTREEAQFPRCDIELIFLRGCGASTQKGCTSNIW